MAFEKQTVHGKLGFGALRQSHLVRQADFACLHRVRLAELAKCTGNYWWILIGCNRFRGL